MKLAVVGGGPSAFYVATRLLSRRPSSVIHIYDRLWAPHGLIRYGVAPDHPEVKNCTHKFDETARYDGFRFYGNVDVGTTLPLSSIEKSYTHLLYANGCPKPVLHPAIRSSSRCLPAIDIVHWYTSRPSRVPPTSPPLQDVEHATIIGHGNVALDVARMLLASPDHLAQFDVPTSVLDVLRKSRLRHISILGRRGPLQASFTNKEVREMMQLPGVAFTPLDSSLLDPGNEKLTRQQTRFLSLLRTRSSSQLSDSPRSWSLEFFRSPAAFDPPHLTVSHTALNVEKRAAETGEQSTLNTDLVITSLGNAPDGESLQHDGVGRVVSRPRVYVSGWAAIGARGVLNETLLNAYTVADTILADLEAPPPLESAEPSANAMNPAPSSPDAPPPEIEEALQKGKVCTYADWLSISAEEIRLGAEMRKERERFMRWEDARAVLRRG